MGSPAMDKNGSIGIGYSFGGSPYVAGQRFAGRLATDPKVRWEDYSQTAVDPSDDCTIWYVGDYFKKDATSYSTRIGAFRMPGCRGLR
jgi:hypothetical protein